VIHLLDTGPLVALLNRRDRHHAWARAVLDTISPPLLTCDAVLAEACHLLRSDPAGPRAVLALVEDGVIVPALSVATEISALRRLMAKYAAQPMSLADAGLVRLSELHPDCRVLTTDEDFRTYRRHGRQVIAVVMPESR
jgi:uncharacterized protein